MGSKSWIIKLAIRHLSTKATRKAVRLMNFFAFAGLALSVFAWITVVSVMAGLQSQVRDRILSEKPHILWEGRPEPEAKLLKSKIEKQVNDQLLKVETYLRSESLVEILKPDRKVQSGALLEGRDDITSGEALAGSEVFSHLSASPGDELRVRSVWALEQFPLKLTLTGLFESGLHEIDSNILRISRGDLSEWLGLGADSYSFIAIYLKNPELAQPLSESLKLVFPQLDFKTWQEVDSALWYSLRLEKIVMSLAVFFVVVLSIFALYMSISVRLAEKGREMALLRGLGAQNSDLQKIFLIEGGLMASLAACLGVGLSWVFCRLISDWLSLPDFYYSTSIPVDWNWGRALGLAFVVVLLGLLSTWWPLRRGFEFSIAESLRS